MSTKPTFLLLPGASVTTEYYNTLISMLQLEGYPAVTIALPSVDAKPSKYDMTEDVQAIRSKVTEIVETDGKEVIVVMHSYATLPGSSALKGLGKVERENMGLSGGITRLVYLTTFLLPEDTHMVERGDCSKFFPYQIIDLEAGTSTLNPEMALEILYGELPNEKDRLYWTSQLKPTSVGVFWSKTTYAAWRHIPSTIVLGEKDITMGFEFQKMSTDTAMANKPNMIEDVIVNKTAGHFPMLSQPQWLVGVLRKAAGEVVELKEGK